MLDAASLPHGNLVCDDIHPHINLHRVGIDYPCAMVRILALCRQSESELNAELRLAHTSRSTDDDERF